MMVLFIALAGGVGAVARLVLDGVLRSRASGRYPVGTVVINLSGSLLLGLVVGLTGALLPEAARLVLGTGFLGGYTTFSTAAVETVRLADDRRWPAAWAHGLGMLVAGVGLAALGLGVGLALVG
ncbi:fluoride efflux transporter FluC [uncultured Friedmanniella sp.]|uniref:fluoride efflux transporter FluC n=1 Tax=uncultured Friedmanniella sp. TaxID=335381 RepID=UPI0035CB2E4A